MHVSFEFISFILCYNSLFTRSSEKGTIKNSLFAFGYAYGFNNELLIHIVTFQIFGKDTNLFNTSTQYLVFNDMGNCGTEKIEINFDRMKEGFIPVEITKIGKESANCGRPTDFSFSIPNLIQGKTYHCDIRSKSVGGPIHLPLFDFTFTMEEVANGKVKR